MHRLDLDFHAVARPSVPGWILLVVGLGMVAALVVTHQALDNETARDQARLQALETRLTQLAPSEAAGGDHAGDAALAAARQVLARAERPWGRLFDTLEAAQDQDLAVLSITPDNVRGLVKIHAEARHLGAMLAYHQRLQADAGLRQVTLLDHELVPGGAEAAVRFHIGASWGGGHAGP